MEEFSLCNQARNHIPAEVTLTLYELALAEGEKIVAENAGKDRDQNGKIQERAHDPLGRQPGSLHDHHFAFRMHPVADEYRGSESDHRQDNGHHLREKQDHEFDKYPDRMTISDELVKQADGPTDPINANQDKCEHSERPRELGQYISV